MNDINTNKELSNDNNNEIDLDINRIDIDEDNMNEIDLGN